MSKDKDKAPPPPAAPAAATPAAAPPAAAAAAPAPVDTLAVALARLYLVTPRANSFGAQAPLQAAECLARARRFCADLAPLLYPTDEEAIGVALELTAAHGWGAQLCITIAREYVALRDSIVPPE